MIQEFTFKDVPYVAFEKPTEMPDDIIKKGIRCLFFDKFQCVNEDNGYLLGYFDDDFDSTTYDSDDDYPFEERDGTCFKFCAIRKKLYEEFTGENFSSNKNKTNKTITGGNTMGKLDLGQIISMKMVSSLVADDKKDINIGKLYLLQSMQDNGKIEITDVMKSKMISKLGLDKDTDELPLEKLMLLDMLQSGEMDLTKIISVKLMSKLFNEEEKK